MPKVNVENIQDRFMKNVMIELAEMIARHGAEISGEFAIYVKGENGKLIGYRDLSSISEAGVEAWTNSQGEVEEKPDGRETL